MTVENEHEELVAELPKLEKLSAEERLRAAKRRRLSQLDRWNVRVKNEDLFPPIVKANKGKAVKFEDTIALIESSARNDAEEGIQISSFFNFIWPALTACILGTSFQHLGTIKHVNIQHKAIGLSEMFLEL